MRSVPSLSRLGALLLLCGLGLPPALASGQPLPNTVTLDFTDADIAGVARTLSVITGRNIVVDARVQGTLSLHSETSVTPARAWEQFQAAVRMRGYTVVEAAGLYKIVPEAEGKLQATSVQAGAGPLRGDQIVTEIFRLSHENANNLVPTLRPLISPNNVLSVNAGNNTLVVTDYASNLARLRTLIAALDTPSATDVEVMPLQHAVAADLAATVQRLTETAGTAASANASTTGAATATPAGAGGSAGAGTGASILADPQSNSLLVRAPNPVQLAFIRALVARLDHPRKNANVHVVYLKNTDATRLAQVLRAAFPADTAGGNRASASTAPAAASKVSAGIPASSTEGSTGTSQSTAAVTATAQPSTGGEVQADPASNALIISAPEPRFQEMRLVIEQLDARRAQLYVESLVVEVDASRSVDLGVQWSKLFDISSSTSLTLGTVAVALESMAGTNILSTANLVTLDNEEAKIVVGQNVPFVTGSYTSTSSSNPFQTVERKDVGITLRIRPQIGQNGNIRMAIYQESSSVVSTSSTLGPTTNKRSIESNVVVNNGKIIVLGGLIEDSYADSAAQVPAVADIPVLGTLFRSISRSRKKTNLIVFLRPIVMADAGASSALSLDRYDYIRAQQQALPADIHLLPQESGPPLLPRAPGN
ncbi:secretin N-terminal domain-containing protein [Pseudorhodoferax sp. Leaf265]|uniref:secretin N-terminal domain-containing protein n=1 Tax=Pseudorhodoferax sp. Leaf265 TaxID=1736315 RepID=UPI000AEDD211|nr:secretin N-terminal domain-containing protein [Pseudorhodoferax sp. Leaf265]